jgi:hypothetical protein
MMNIDLLYKFLTVLQIRIRDPMLFPGSGPRINNPDHISESVETMVWVKILKFLNEDPGWKTFVSGINIPDPQH